MALLELRNVSKSFPVRGGPAFRAVHDASIAIGRGECVAIVGESGSGKSTIARMALGLIEPSEGEVVVKGERRRGVTQRDARRLHTVLQPVFQDPSGSFNPRRTIRSAMRQALKQASEPAADLDRAALGLLADVGLRPPEDFLDRYPHELSGGQRQRLAIARALAPDPELIVADEPLSGADVSIRAQVLNLLIELQRRRTLSYLLITHDTAVARAISNRIVVVYRGRIVEEGETKAVLERPTQEYTRKLLAASNLD